MFNRTSLASLLMLISASAFSQRNILHTPPLKKTGMPSFVLSSVNVPFSLAAERTLHVPDVPYNKVDYPAFFCRLELRSVNRFHIRIKFHAGDYDRYMHISSDYR